MARKKQQVTKEVESINIDVADNGYVIVYSGRDDEDSWTDAKIVVKTLQEVFAEIERVAKL
jgi:hypothetical protein